MRYTLAIVLFIAFSSAQASPTLRNVRALQLQNSGYNNGAPAPQQPAPVNPPAPVVPAATPAPAAPAPVAPVVTAAAPVVTAAAPAVTTAPAAAVPAATVAPAAAAVTTAAVVAPAQTSAPATSAPVVNTPAAVATPAATPAAPQPVAPAQPVDRKCPDLNPFVDSDVDRVRSDSRCETGNPGWGGNQDCSCVYPVKDKNAAGCPTRFWRVCTLDGASAAITGGNATTIGADGQAANGTSGGLKNCPPLVFPAEQPGCMVVKMIVDNCETLMNMCPNATTSASSAAAPSVAGPAPQGAQTATPQGPAPVAPQPTGQQPIVPVLPNAPVAPVAPIAPVQPAGNQPSGNYQG